LLELSSVDSAMFCSFNRTSSIAEGFAVLLSRRSRDRWPFTAASEAECIVCVATGPRAPKLLTLEEDESERTEVGTSGRPAFFVTGGSVGWAVGVSLGVAVGVSLGAAVGVSLGIAVGEMVGASVGLSLGDAVGASDGSGVGLAVVGERVGDSVGDSVGASVGAALVG
jgi:hypothetical protein